MVGVAVVTVAPLAGLGFEITGATVSIVMLTPAEAGEVPAALVAVAVRVRDPSRIVAFGGRLHPPPEMVVVVPRATPSTRRVIVRPLADEVPDTVGTPVARMAPVAGVEMEGTGGGRRTVKLQERDPTFPTWSFTWEETVWVPAERLVVVKLNPVAVSVTPVTGTAIPSSEMTALLGATPVPASDQDAETVGAVVEIVDPLAGLGFEMTGGVVSIVTETP